MTMEMNAVVWEVVIHQIGRYDVDILWIDLQFPTVDFIGFQDSLPME